MAMTLEALLDWAAKTPAKNGWQAKERDDAVALIEAIITQPAQGVDIGAIREVIAALRTWRDEGTDSMARKLTKAISTAPPYNSPTTGAIGENGNG